MILASFSSTILAVILVVAVFILAKAADTVVKALTNLGKILHIKTFVLSFVLLGLTTSLPEMLIGVYSVLDGMPRLSFGNLLGGMVVLLTLVVGLNGLLFSGISLDGKLARFSLCQIMPRIPGCHRLAMHDLSILGFILIMPALLILDSALSRTDGIILVIFYLFFLYYYLREKSNHAENNGIKSSLLSSVGSFMAGALLMVIVARVIVLSSEVLLTRLNVSSFLFGLLVLGLGTNLPELTIMLRSQKSARDISVANALGSAAANVIILGFLAIFSPLSNLRNTSTLLTAGILMAVTILVVVFFRTRDRLSRTEALILVLIYIAFFAIQSFIRM
ncbi:MAG: CaCA family calcium (Ca2+):cation antiporter [Parcubacteria group bacterium GW2011_GWC2_45_7]|nr:MAG: CaCA family calcium (Ca2+):cation antiporter [Parcubacteria group bacterium GW2011_GWC2_45_7]KKU73164.1 MAG: CaCA family calcium (Ca2+):cation antiporter [Parcubacteria group bacterium GW2011_GWA2_47_26]